MTAEVIVLPNQNNTEMLRKAGPEPAGSDDTAYVLDLEQENLDLRDALASSALRAWRQRPRVRVAVAVIAVTLAFGSGWLLDPPYHLFSEAEADAATRARAPVGPDDRNCTLAPRETEAPGEPRLPRDGAFHAHQTSLNV